ncbi:MAG TPA: hypothetical protein VK927_10905 [Adhaeribacter sp.]|nr:hypothetical protein [Adhaeribacter sp.]
MKASEFFPYLGLNIEVNEGTAIDRAFIKFTANGVTTEIYINKLESSKIDQTVIVHFSEVLKDLAGKMIRTEQKTFRATDQETAEYFYNLPGGPVTGLEQDRKCINGALIDRFGVLCFHPQNGAFVPPCSTTVETSPASYGQDPNDPNNPIQVLMKDGSISITVIDGQGPFTHEISGPNGFTGQFTENLIENLESGTYKIQTFSATNLPCIRIVVV